MSPVGPIDDVRFAQNEVGPLHGPRKRRIATVHEFENPDWPLVRHPLPRNSDAWTARQSVWFRGIPRMSPGATFKRSSGADRAGDLDFFRLFCGPSSFVRLTTGRQQWSRTKIQ